MAYEERSSNSPFTPEPSSSSAEWLGAAVERLRTERGLSRSSLAQSLGIDEKSLSRIEHGESIPRASTVKSLNDFFCAGTSDYDPGHLVDLRASALSARGTQGSAPSDTRSVTETFSGRGARLLPSYEAALAGHPESIDLLGCGFRQILEDFGTRLPKVLATAKVRMLLLDPEPGSVGSWVAAQRDREEGRRPGSIQQDVGDWSTRHSQLTETEQARLAIRVYNAAATINVVRIGGTMFWGPYLTGRVSRNMPTLRTNRGTLLFEVLQQHFDELWAGQFSRELVLIPDATGGADRAN